MRSSEILLKLMRGEEMRPAGKPLDLGDSFWQYFVPSNQQDSGKNEKVFRQNLARITQKLRFDPFTNQSKTFVLADTLTDLELQQMLLWLTHLNYEAIEFPTEPYESKIFQDPLNRVLKPRYEHWQAPFESAIKPGSSLSLATDNADLIIPVLPHLRISRLVIRISSSPKGWDISVKQFEQLAAVLGSVKSLKELDISSSDFRSPAAYANLKISQALSLALRGSFPAEELASLARALNANRAIFSLSFYSCSVSKGVHEFIEQLGTSYLTRLELHDSPVFAGDSFKLLVASLPASLETLVVTRCGLEDKDCESLVSKLAASKIRVLNLSDNNLKNWPQSLGKIINRSSLVSINLNRNNALGAIEEICQALMQPDCPLQELGISESYVIRAGGLSFSNAARANTSLPTARANTALITCAQALWRNISETKIIHNLYPELLKSMSSNFKIRSGGFYDVHGYLNPAEQFNLFLKRNLRLYEAQNLLEKVHSGQIRNSIILEKIIPEKLKEVLDISSQSMAAYPEAHLACLGLCEKISAACKALNSRNESALKLQSIFRSVLRSLKDGHQARALFSIKKQEQAFYEYCRENEAYGTLEEFALNMGKKDYISALNTLNSAGIGMLLTPTFPHK